MPATSTTAPGRLLRRLVNHNPFYVISAALVLFGLHISFTGTQDPGSGWMQMILYCSYMLLLAVVAYAVIRFGQIWEDARTVLLIIVLLLIALSNSFDSLLYSDPTLGIQLLGFGFLFAVIISEGLLAALRMRLPLRYRLPYYLQMLLLFAYPVLLHSLMADGRKQDMRECVLVYPILVAFSLLCLIPAARGKPHREPENGTPWKWPLYPWPLFVITAVGMTLRSYSLTLSFEVGSALETGFESYFLFPILFAVVILIVEMSIAAGAVSTTKWLLMAPLGLLVLAFPGQPTNELQRGFLEMVQTNAGSPIALALVGLVIFYLVHILRATPRAELAFCLSLCLAAVTDSRTVDITTMAAPHLGPLLLLAIYLSVTGIAQRSSPRLLAAGLLILALPIIGWKDMLNWQYGYCVFCTVVILVAFIGITLSDRLGSAIRRAMPVALVVIALLSAASWPLVCPRIAPIYQYVGLVMFAAMALFYWLRLKRASDLVAVTNSVGSLTLWLALQIVIELQHRQVLKGLQFLAWGMAFLVVALLVSLIKGGLVHRLRSLFDTINRAVHRGNELTKENGSPP